MKQDQASWQQEESKIFLRDLFFMAATILLSILIAEQILLKEDADLVDRVFAYLAIFIPLGVINLIAHYYYRNLRIRLTGNLRTSLRYRLSLAFLLVAVIPSMPIFLISSNMVEDLVKGIFRIDVGGALDAGDKILKYYKQQESAAFLKSIRDFRPGYFAGQSGDKQLIVKLYSNRVLLTGSDYAGLYVGGKMIYETAPLFSYFDMAQLRAPIKSRYVKSEVSIKNMDYVFYRFPLKNPWENLILGRRLHPGLENHFNKFNSVYSGVKERNIWRETIPFNIRLGLSLVYAFMVAFSLVMAWIIARKISMPIVSIAQATRDVTDGHLDTRLDIQAQGEMGILIDSFNQMTAELRNLKAQVLHSQRVAAWQEVARRLAHEIKNPLTPIQLSAERMLRRLDHPEKGRLNAIIKSGATTIVEQVSVLKSMVEEFADFARMPKARLVNNSLDVIVAEAVNLYKESVDVPIELKLAGNLPMILLDKNIIIGMINNLIKNGLEAIESVPEEQQRTPGLRIQTGLQRRGIRRFVMLKVEDSGPGIDESLAEKIFEPYFSTKGEHGNGLGLALVERAVLEHDARISVGRSSLGGAEFTILFRVKPI